ncbi:MAG TPA: hypothetical protein PK974_08205 [Rhodocyclaceae bacterium]|nr:hypothetical protein [Rhodocyclaceae bacterium]
MTESLPAALDTAGNAGKSGNGGNGGNAANCDDNACAAPGQE